MRRVFFLRESLQTPWALDALSRPFVRYTATNVPQKCREHFYGLREAKPDLVAIALFDRLDKELAQDTPLVETMWRRREIENYFCTEAVLCAYARHDLPDDLFGAAEASRREKAMRESIAEVVEALTTLDRPGRLPWSDDIKASDDFLEPVFRKYFAKLKLPVLFRKTDYHSLAAFLSARDMDAEIREKLDMIAAVAARARPVGE